MENQTIIIEKNKAYLNISQIPSMVFNLTFSNNIPLVKFISENVYELLGYKSEDIIHNKINMQSLIYQEDFFYNIELIKKNIEMNKKNFDFRCRMYTSNHQIKHFRILVSISLHKDKLSDITGIATDITTEIELQQKLTGNTNKWKMLIESTNTAYLITNEDGLIIDANEKITEMIGCKGQKKLIGANIKQIIAKKDLKKLDVAMNKVINGECIENLELNIADNEDIPCNVSWVSINAGLIENGIKKIFCIVRDISDSKKHEVTKFIRNQKQKDAFKQSIFEIRDLLNKRGKKC